MLALGLMSRSADACSHACCQGCAVVDLFAALLGVASTLASFGGAFVRQEPDTLRYDKDLLGRDLEYTVAA